MDKKKIIKTLIKALELLGSVGIMILSCYLLIQIISQVWSLINWIVTGIVSVLAMYGSHYFINKSSNKPTNKSTEHKWYPIILSISLLAIYSIAVGAFSSCILLFFIIILYVPSSIDIILYPILYLVLLGQFLYSLKDSIGG